MSQNLYGKKEICENYFCCEDEKNFYIINKTTNEIIWSEEKLAGKTPTVEMIGMVRSEPVFWDCLNKNYILPTFKAGHREYFSLIRPVIINGDNIVNIVGDKGGLGVVDFANPGVIKPGYDRVKLELKVTLENDSRVREEYYPIPNGIFHSDIG